MAAVVGPISSLPGQHHTVPKGTMCDVCQERPAAVRVQGETDSFGAELNDFCEACYDRAKAEDDALKCGSCEWCHKASNDLRPTRDYDEGSCGPVYRVCGACRLRQSQDAQEELAWMHRNDPEVFEDE
jgi:hypothetical protein